MRGTSNPEVGSMPQVICPTCNGKGHVVKEKIRVENGQSRTERTEEVCPQCNWTGWING